MFRFKLAQAKAGTAITQFMAQHAQGAESAHFLIGGIRVGFIQLSGDPL